MSKKKDEKNEQPEQSEEDYEARLNKLLEDGNWKEQEPLSENAMKIMKAMEGMDLKTRTEAILEALAHDYDMTYIIMGRYFFEILYSIRATHPEMKTKDVYMQFGRKADEYAQNTMRTFFQDEIWE